MKGTAGTAGIRGIMNGKVRRLFVQQRLVHLCLKESDGRRMLRLTYIHPRAGEEAPTRQEPNSLSQFGSTSMVACQRVIPRQYNDIAMKW
jgi:hypothetical protein